MSETRFTHIGGPTVLVEVGGWRILTDPTSDPPGRRYFFGWGTTSRKLVGPSTRAEELGPIDAVLVSHHHHGDNLVRTNAAADMGHDGHDDERQHGCSTAQRSGWRRGRP